MAFKNVSRKSSNPKSPALVIQDNVSVENWGDVEKQKDPFYINFKELAGVLKSKKETHYLTAWSIDDNQFDKYPSPRSQYTSADNTPHEVMGSLTISGQTFVFYFDSEDGHRSSSNKVLVIPGHTPKNEFVPYDVEFVPSSDEDWEEENDENGCIDMMIKGTKDVAAHFGTEMFESWYPNAIFQVHPEVLTVHLPSMSKNHIKGKLAEKNTGQNKISLRTPERKL